MKKLSKQSYRYICFEVARLRTRWDNDKDNRLVIEKRYREVIKEFNSRTDNWFWTKHPIDKIIKEQAILEKMKKAKHSRTKCMECSKAPEVEVMWANGMAHAWFCNKCYGVWKKRKFKLNGKAYTYGEDINKERKIDGEASKKWSEPIKKADDWCSQKGGHWITASGKHICIGDDKDIGGGNKERSLISPEHKTKLIYVNKRKELAEFATTEYNRFPEDLKGRFGEVEINDKYATFADYYREKGLPIPDKYETNAPELGGMTRGDKIIIYQGGSERAVLHEYGHMIEPKHEKMEQWKTVWGKDNLGEDKSNEGFATAYRMYVDDSEYFKEGHPGLHGFMDGYLSRKIEKAEDWCSQAQGKWITDDGQHICVGIKRPSKVPKKLRGFYEKQTSVKADRGYRIGEPTTMDPREVYTFEIEELGNDHLLEEGAKALNTKKNKESVLKAIEDQFGKDAKVIWLGGDKERIQEFYGPGEAYEIKIPEDALILSDLGDEGQLWVWPGEKKEKREKTDNEDNEDNGDNEGNKVRFRSGYGKKKYEVELVKEEKEVD